MRASLLLVVVFLLAFFCSVDLQAGMFSTHSPMASARTWHSATLLQNGKVLITGGYRLGQAVAENELYDPASGTWGFTGMMKQTRYSQSATLLRSGKVLVTGGSTQFGEYLATSELYDPLTGEWVATGSLAHPRKWHTATLLPDGRVLVAGGQGPELTYPAAAEIYDPQTERWSAAESIGPGRIGHSATLLPNGNVAVTGGFVFQPAFEALDRVEIYSPVANSWRLAAPLRGRRGNHAAILLRNGKLLVAGGFQVGGWASAAELYDYQTDQWHPAPPPQFLREGGSPILLPDGRVLLFGGGYNNRAVKTAELFDPSSGTWSLDADLNTGRNNNTATLLPNGRVFIAGGDGSGDSDANIVLAGTELYEYAKGEWEAGGILKNARISHTATLLPNGTVLLAGGAFQGEALAAAELYDAGLRQWTEARALSTARHHHTATLLPNGEVLAVGGLGREDRAISSAERFDHKTGAWNEAGGMQFPRAFHIATLLPNGKVLVAGGEGNDGILGAAELYDFDDRSWRSTASLKTPRSGFTATLLFSGVVLVTGGRGARGELASAEIYDPASGTWTMTGAMNTTRSSHTATLLRSGKVLVAGGFGGRNTAEIYDPARGTWEVTGNLDTARFIHSAVLMQDGKVLVTGGVRFDGHLSTISSAEMFDPHRGVWSPVNSLAAERYHHTSTLLASGRVLITGGGSQESEVSTSELFDPGLGYQLAWRPQIETVTSNLLSGGRMDLTGSGFSGTPDAGGSSRQSSSTAHPLVEIRALESGFSQFLEAGSDGGWTSNSFHSGPISAFPQGFAFVTVFVNGIPSQSSFVRKQNVNASVSLTNLVHVYDGTPKPAQPVLTPFVFPVHLRYEGSSNPPVNAGVYNVIATVDPFVGTGIATNQLVIQKAPARIDLGFLERTYYGGPHFVVLTSDVPVRSIEVIYEGTNSVPIDAGEYPFIATVIDSNYTGNAGGVLAILPAQAGVFLSNLEQVYDGSPKTPDVFTSPVTLPVGFTYNRSNYTAVLPGVYQVEATVLDRNYTGSATNQLRILPPAPRLQSTLIANGSSLMAFTNAPGLTFLVLTATNLALPEWTVLGPVSEITPGAYRFGFESLQGQDRRFFRLRSE